jgi:hypothetical protein
MFRVFNQAVGPIATAIQFIYLIQKHYNGQQEQMKIMMQTGQVDVPIFH